MSTDGSIAASGVADRCSYNIRSDRRAVDVYGVDVVRIVKDIGDMVPATAGNKLA